MQRFISGRDIGRTTSPSKGRSQQPVNNLTPEVVAERQRRGAGARVEIPHTNADDDSRYESDPQAPHQQISRPPQRRAAQSARQLRKTELHRNDELFDTDPENADATTITNLSNGFDEDQLSQQNGYAPYHYQGDDDRESFNGDSSQFASDENSELDGHAFNHDDAAVLQLANQQTGGSDDQRGMFAPSEPYPSTTDPDAEGEETEVENGPEDYKQPDPYTGVPRPTPQEHSQPYAPQDPYTAMRFKDPALQESIRPKTKLPLRTEAAKAEYAHPIGIKPAPNVEQRQPIRTKPAHPPPVQPRGSQTPTHSPPPIPNAETPQARKPFGRVPFAPQQQPGQHQMPPTPSEAGSKIPLDYDDNELKHMPYTTLAAESFDHIPRGIEPAPFANPDTTLPERLDIALTGLDPNGQACFFASLPLEEWEDAGDWFLKRFGDLLGKSKEARRKKRDAARKFEEEILERSEVVGRKKRCVEEEIGNMRNKGQTLLPDTPARRRGATPAFGSR